jgi:hypothetical protein
VDGPKESSVFLNLHGGWIRAVPVEGFVDDGN